MVVSSRWGYELAAVSHQGSRKGLTVCVVHWLETRVRRDSALSSRAVQGHGFCPADRESHRLCCLFRSHCEQVVEWATQLPVCSGQDL